MQVEANATPCIRSLRRDIANEKLQSSRRGLTSGTSFVKSTEAEVVFLEELVAIIAEKWYFITVVWFS